MTSTTCFVTQPRAVLKFLTKISLTFAAKSARVESTRAEVLQLTWIGSLTFPTRHPYADHMIPLQIILQQCLTPMMTTLNGGEYASGAQSTIMIPFLAPFLFLIVIPVIMTGLDMMQDTMGITADTLMTRMIIVTLATPMETT